MDVQGSENKSTYERIKIKLKRSQNQIMNKQNEPNIVEEELKENDQGTSNDLRLESSTVNLVETSNVKNEIFAQKLIVVSVLTTINLVNFMDRFTIAGKISQISGKKIK
jgi:hypothetical protein